MSYNSTIRQKQGICPLCPGTNKQPLIGGMCSRHYWDSRKMKSAQRQQEKELEQDEDLQTLVNDLDIIFSRYVRLKDADRNGHVFCFTCATVKHYTAMHCGHFIGRGHMYTRFSENNCKPQCPHCNVTLSGNIAEFARHLENDNLGSVEILQEQARTVYHYGKDELRGMISGYSAKLKKLQKGIYR